MLLSEGKRLFKRPPSPEASEFWDISKARRQSGERVALDVQLLDVLQFAEGGRDFAGEAIGPQVQHHLAHT